MPVPRPRQRTANISIRTEQQPSLTEDEDIYTDNSPATNQMTGTPPVANQIKSRKVAWADEANSTLQSVVRSPPVGGLSTPSALPPAQQERELALNRVRAPHERCIPYSM